MGVWESRVQGDYLVLSQFPWVVWLEVGKGPLYTPFPCYRSLSVPCLCVMGNRGLGFKDQKDQTGVGLNLGGSRPTHHISC